MYMYYVPALCFCNTYFVVKSNTVIIDMVCIIALFFITFEGKSLIIDFILISYFNNGMFVVYSLSLNQEYFN